MLEHEVRDVLNRTAPRRFAVLRPLRLVIENYPEGQVEELEAVNNPEDPSAGTRKVPFARELWIERDDFMEDPPSKFFRLAPGREVRLRYAYFVTCTDVVKDATGEIVELRCTYDPATRGGDAPDGRRPKATLHWLSSEHAVPAEVRLYDRLFTRSDPGADGDLFADLNPDSETVLEECLVEPALAELPVGETVQFERLGYFCPDPDSTPERLVFNRTLGLRDTWAKAPGAERQAMSEPRSERLTAAQRAALAAELAELEGPKRTAVVQAIKTAREHGDLSENFEYHAAKNEQGLLEARIRTLRSRLDNAEVVDESTIAAGEIGVGSLVEIEDDAGEPMEVVISSVREPGSISPDSPLGRALLGRGAGESVDVEAPRGRWTARILSVRRP